MAGVAQQNDATVAQPLLSDDHVESKADGEQPSSDALADLSSSSNIEAEAVAILNWVHAVDRARGDEGMLSRTVEKVEDICDGVAFFEMLATVDAAYFRNPHGAEVKDNWVLKTATLKRLFKLITQYYLEVLQQSPKALEMPDLDLLARDGSHEDLCKLARLVIGIAVRSERASEHIEAIQSLSLEDQQQLMYTIEQVMSALQPLDTTGDATEDSPAPTGDASSAIDGDSDINTLQNGQMSAAAAVTRRENPAADLEKLYMNLLDAHRMLQASHDDVVAEKEEGARELARFREEVEHNRNVQADVLMRQEIERLKSELRRSEDNLAAADSELERLNASVADLMRKSEDQQRKTEENVKLKDQLEELKHASDKLQRAENVMEKYKKKLEEGTEVRRQLKLLETQNAELVDRNAAIEDEYKRIAHFKPLMDSYKGQIAEAEAKVSNLQRDLNAAQYEQEQTAAKLRATEEARLKEKEEMDLYQERIQELELGGGLAKRRAPTDVDVNGAEGLAAANNDLGSDDEAQENLEDALSGTTMTGLKLQVRKLMRELSVARANKADAGRLLVVENLLQDANKTKDRYEHDYLREYQKGLKLSKQLELIQQGKAIEIGDGPEANLALRMRLNETVEELDELKRKAKEMEVEFEQTKNELTIARSDLMLVDKDKLEMIDEVRATVNVEKAGLERTLTGLREEMTAKEEQIRMQLSQINTLLIDKVDLQQNAIEQHDQEMGELRSSMQGNVALSPELLATHETQVKMLQEKLQKARAFIRQQDKMIKDFTKESETGVRGPDKASEQEIKILRQEQTLVSSAWHDMVLRVQFGGSPGIGGGSNGGGGASHSTRAHTKAAVGLNGVKPRSWLLQQRNQIANGIPLVRR